MRCDNCTCTIPTDTQANPVAEYLCTMCKAYRRQCDRNLRASLISQGVIKPLSTLRKDK